MWAISTLQAPLAQFDHGPVLGVGSGLVGGPALGVFSFSPVVICGQVRLPLLFAANWPMQYAQASPIKISLSSALTDARQSNEPFF